MADTRNQSETAARGGPGLARQERGIQRSDPAFGSWGSPFEWMNRMSQEMDHAFDRLSRDLGFHRGSWVERRPFGLTSGQDIWSPRIEAFHKGDRFIVRAELPGLKKEDVNVELTEDALTIRGERKEERQEEREGYYHSESEYGQFYRTVPLPEGVISESAKASFRDGILEINIQAAPHEANRGRRLEISDASQAETQKK